MAQMFVDPQKLAEFIRLMDSFSKTAKDGDKKVKQKMNQLKQNWKDNHYKAFEEQYNDFEKMYLKSLQMLDEVILPNLKNVHKLAEAYKKGGR